MPAREKWERQGTKKRALTQNFKWVIDGATAGQKSASKEKYPNAKISQS